MNLGHAKSVVSQRRALEVVQNHSHLLAFNTLHVSLHVQGQVIRAGKTALAVAALERFDPSVLPMVPGQLVRPRETPFAALP